VGREVIRNDARQFVGDVLHGDFLFDWAVAFNDPTR
jgi:hypothetical protein